VSPGDHVDVRVEGTGMVHDQPRGGRIVHGRDDHPRTVDARLPEDVGVRGVAVQGRLALPSQMLHCPPVRGDHDAAEPAALESLRDHLPHPSIAAHDRVLADRFGPDGSAPQPPEMAPPALEQGPDTWSFAEAPVDRLDREEQQWVDGDRDERPGDDELEPVRGQEPEVGAERRDDE
jgi:hypothetical protein